MTYRVTKTYGHEQGLSVCFRQHRASSHCSQLHGYAIAVEIIFESETLDGNSWVINFGSLKPVKKYLNDTFDHILLVAEDDPHLDSLCGLAGLGLANVLVVKSIGCESFASMIYSFVYEFLLMQKLPNNVKLCSVKVSEHAGNSATYIGE